MFFPSRLSSGSEDDKHLAEDCQLAELNRIDRAYARTGQSVAIRCATESCARDDCMRFFDVDCTMGRTMPDGSSLQSEED